VRGSLVGCPLPPLLKTDSIKKYKYIKMPFPKKPVVTVGRNDWAVEVPRPPKFATHAVLTMDTEFKDNGKPKTSTLPIEDFGCFKGVSGSFYYVRMDSRRVLKETYKGTWYWDGYKVEGIEDLRNSS
jgi:hypothetical protein